MYCFFICMNMQSISLCVISLSLLKPQSIVFRRSFPSPWKTGLYLLQSRINERYSEVLLTALIEFQGSKPCRWHMQLLCTEHSLCVSSKLGKMHTCFNCWLSAIWWKSNVQIQIMQWISSFLSLAKDIHGEPLLLPQAKRFIYLFVEESTILLLSGCDREEIRKNRLSHLVLRKQKCEMHIIRWSITTFSCQTKAFICGLIFLWRFSVSKLAFNFVFPPTFT